MKKVPLVTKDEKCLYDDGNVAISNKRLYYAGRRAMYGEKMKFVKIVELRSITSIVHAVIKNSWYLITSIISFILMAGCVTALIIMAMNNMFEGNNFMLYLIIGGSFFLLMGIILLVVYFTKRSTRCYIEYEGNAGRRIKLRTIKAKKLDEFVKHLYAAIDGLDSKPSMIKKNRLNLPF